MGEFGYDLDDLQEELERLLNDKWRGGVEEVLSEFVPYGCINKIVGVIEHGALLLIIAREHSAGRADKEFREIVGRLKGRCDTLGQFIGELPVGVQQSVFGADPLCFEFDLREALRVTIARCDALTREITLKAGRPGDATAAEVAKDVADAWKNFAGQEPAMPQLQRVLEVAYEGFNDAAGNRRNWEHAARGAVYEYEIG